MRVRGGCDRGSLSPEARLPSRRKLVIPVRGRGSRTGSECPPSGRGPPDRPAADLNYGTVAVRLGEAIAALEARYDPARAESWDAVGLVCGDPDESVRRVIFAVDPTGAGVDDVIGMGAGLLVTHHPLLLTPVHAVPADDPKGRLVHRLIRAEAALFVAHTNADRAPAHGVNDALADVLGLTDSTPLEPDDRDPRAGLGRGGRLRGAGSPRQVAPKGPAVLPG